MRAAPSSITLAWNLLDAYKIGFGKRHWEAKKRRQKKLRQHIKKGKQNASRIKEQAQSDWGENGSYAQQSAAAAKHWQRRRRPYKYDILYSHHFSHIITQFYVLLNSQERISSGCARTWGIVVCTQWPILELIAFYLHHIVSRLDVMLTAIATVLSALASAVFASCTLTLDFIIFVSYAPVVQVIHYDFLRLFDAHHRA